MFTLLINLQNINMDKISDILLNRRTIRKYSQEPVDETLLNELLTRAAGLPLQGTCRFTAS